MYKAADIEPFFFEAMKKGFVQNKAQGTIPELPGLPGSKTISHEKGDFRLIDYWFTGVRHRSFGNTIIYAGNIPVWMMNYWGYYEDGVIPFLKRALSVEYMRDYHPMEGDPQFFKGCRGPRVYRGDNLAYVNMPTPGGSFWEFSGREEIFNEAENNVSRGWHQYHGYMLL